MSGMKKKPFWFERNEEHKNISHKKAVGIDNRRYYYTKYATHVHLLLISVLLKKIYNTIWTLEWRKCAHCTQCNLFSMTDCLHQRNYQPFTLKVHNTHMYMYMYLITVWQQCPTSKYTKYSSEKTLPLQSEKEAKQCAEHEEKKWVQPNH